MSYPHILSSSTFVWTCDSCCREFSRYKSIVFSTHTLLPCLYTGSNRVSCGKDRL
uniref:Uncharacterized protein n=1 Tax=Arundo donax TaxID=35708 RepID=A0A0A9FM29_ARUDO